MGYGSIAYLVFAYLIVRIGVLYGWRIPLVFAGLLVLGRYTLPETLGLYRFPVFVCILAIGLALFDRWKSLKWNQL